MSILLFIVILLVLVLVHEFGHFAVAKWAKIRVDEFAFGFPPRIFGKRFGETTYSFNLLPLGGYVKIYGEDSNQVEEGKDAERSFVRQPRSVQAAVIVAGVIMNIVLAWVLISATLMIGIAAPADNDDGLPVANARLMVTDVSRSGPAEAAGIAGGDYLINISDGKTTVSATSAAAVSNFISQRASTTLFVAYEHLGKVETATVTPVLGISERGAAIGVYMDMVGTLELAPLSALTHGATKTWEYTELTAIGIARFLKQAVTGRADLDEVTGPVGIVKAVGDASHIGIANLLLFTALISINLAIINIIPFPALDGGRLLFIMIEAITRRPIPVRAANLMNNLGFALLIGLMILVTFHDVVKLF